jgi:hypothetical protein
MIQVERPGIASQWKKSWERVARNQHDLIHSNRPGQTQSLEEYVLRGITDAEIQAAKEIPSSEVNPPRALWESTYLSSPMEGALFYPEEFERSSLDSGVFASDIAARCFAANYTGQMINFYRHELFPLRFNGRNRKGLHLSSTAFSALGFIVGCNERAIRLARMQLAGHRKGYFDDKIYYPLFNFILRLFADYLNEPAPVLEGETLKEPIFNALFDIWRHPDPEALTHVALAACDYHTHRCKPGNAKNFYEFENGRWTRTPFEILLMFKMRQKLGLQNPVLDHPLMNTALGVLPAETPFESDELVARVRARMFTEGYDEDAIYQMVIAH